MKYAWAEKDIPDLSGKNIIVTGTGGLGFDAALMFAQAGGDVVLAGRNAEKGAQAVQQILRIKPTGSARFELLDLANLRSVTHFAERLSEQINHLDILVNNAGVMAPPKRQTTVDGFELQLGTNHLGHFALTAHLLPLLQESQDARVVSVSSIAHRSGQIKFDDLQWEKDYAPWPSYGQSKLAVLMFALELQRQSNQHGWGIASYGAHPGVARTELMANGPGKNSIPARVMRLFGPLLTHSSKAGTLPIVFAATSPLAMSGGYYGPTGFYEMIGRTGDAKVSKGAANVADGRRLWQMSEELVGLQFSGVAQKG